MKIIKRTIFVLTLFFIGLILTLFLTFEKEDYADGLIWTIHSLSDYQVESIDITSINIAATSTIIAKEIKLETEFGDQKIAADFVEIQFVLMSLFSKRLDIEELIVRDAVITINNKAGLQELNSEDFLIPVIEHAKLINVLISCQCPNNKQLSLEIADISIFDNSSGEIRISGEGEFEHVPFQLTANLGASIQVKQQSSPFPIDIGLQLANSSLEIKGGVEDPIELEGFELSFSGEVQELTELTRHFVNELPKLGQAHLDFSLTGDWDDLHISDLKAQLTNDSSIDVKMEGGINDILGEVESSVQINGKLNEAKLIKYLLADTVPVGLTAINFDSLIDIKDEFASIKELDLQLLFENHSDIHARGKGHFNLRNITLFDAEFDLAVTAKSSSTGALTSVIEAQLPELGNVTMDTNVTLVDGLVSLHNLSLVVGSEDKLKVSVSGELEEFTFDSDFYEIPLDLDIALSGKNIDHLISTRGRPRKLAGIESLTAKLKLSGSMSKSEVDVENIEVNHSDGITLQAQGKLQLADIRQADPLNHVLLHLESHVNKMEALSPWVETKLPLLGEVVATATLQGQGQHFSLRDLYASVGDKSSIWIETKGNIEKIYYSDEVIWSGLAMQAQFQANNLTSIAEHLDLSLPKIKQVNGVFKLSGNSKSLAISDLNFTGTNLTGIRLEGSGSVRNTGLLKNNKLSGVDITLMADAESNISLEPIIEHELPDFGRLHISASLREYQNKLGLEDIVLTVGGSQKHAIHITGHIHNVLDSHRLNLNAQVETEASIILEHLLDKEITEMGMMTANILISNYDGSLGIENLELSSAIAGLYQLRAKGTFDDYNVGDELKFELDLSVPNPQLLGQKLGYKIADFEPMRFIGSVEGDNERSVFEGDLNIGKTHFESDLVVSYIDSHPILTGSLHSQDIDLKDLAIHHEKFVSDNVDNKDSRLFSSQVLPFYLLRDMDLELLISADEIKGTKFNIDTAGAHIEVHNELLAINSASLIFDDGFVSMNASVAVDTEQPRLKFELQSNDVDIGQVTSQFLEKHSIDGDLTMHMEFSGEGRSIAEIAASLEGDVAMALDNGILHEANLALLNIDFLGWFFEHLIQKKEAKIHCAMSHHKVNNGLAELKMLMIATPDLEASGEGNINLKDETIDLTIYADNRSIFKPKTPISVKGSLRSPTVTVLPSLNFLTSLFFSIVPEAMLTDIVLSKFWNLVSEGDVDSKCEKYLP